MDELQGIIFDFNGVLLLDSHLQEAAWNECALELRGREFSKEELDHRVHGRTNADTLTYLLGRTLSPGELVQYIDLKEGIYQRMCLEHKGEFKLAPGAAEFLDYLKDTGKAFTIATSSWVSNLRFYFEHLPLAKWFDYDKVAHDDGTVQGKPAPDLFLKAAKNLGLAPADCIVIEDARSGIQAAHRAGIGKIIAFVPSEKQAAFAQLAGVNDTMEGFEALLRHHDDLWSRPR